MMIEISSRITTRLPIIAPILEVLVSVTPGVFDRSTVVVVASNLTLVVVVSDCDDVCSDSEVDSVTVVVTVPVTVSVVNTDSEVVVTESSVV